MEAIKVVFHVSDEERITNAYNNIKNILKDRADTQVTLLLNGPAAKLVTFEEKLEELVSLHIDVKVCRNSLNGMKIKEEELIKGITVVPTGVLELVYRQQDGYAYIKP